MHSLPNPQIDIYGAIRWHLKGELHRTDGPAFESADGTKEWYTNGELHRVDGPAVENCHGGKQWYINGRRHRTDGPAFEGADGTKQWYVNGRRHRIDGPAMEYADGAVSWWLNGEQHRTDGPAVEWADGSKEWWVDGKDICPPYSNVLTAAFSRGLPVPPDVLQEMLKAMSESDDVQNEQLNQLDSILHKYWPMHVKQILAMLFMNPDPAIKHLAFSLLGLLREPERPPGARNSLS